MVLSRDLIFRLVTPRDWNKSEMCVHAKPCQSNVNRLVDERESEGITFRARTYTLHRQLCYSWYIAPLCCCCRWQIPAKKHTTVLHGIAFESERRKGKKWEIPREARERQERERGERGEERKLEKGKKVLNFLFPNDGGLKAQIVAEWQPVQQPTSDQCWVIRRKHCKSHLRFAILHCTHSVHTAYTERLVFCASSLLRAPRRRSRRSFVTVIWCHMQYASILFDAELICAVCVRWDGGMGERANALNAERNDFRLRPVGFSQILLLVWAQKSNHST